MSRTSSTHIQIDRVIKAYIYIHIHIHIHIQISHIDQQTTMLEKGASYYIYIYNNFYLSAYLVISHSQLYKTSFTVKHR